MLAQGFFHLFFIITAELDFDQSPKFCFVVQTRYTYVLLLGLVAEEVEVLFIILASLLTNGRKKLRHGHWPEGRRL